MPTLIGGHWPTCRDSSGEMRRSSHVGLWIMERRSLREIPQSSINSKFAVSLGMGLDFDDVIALNGSSSGVVCDGVLVAYIAGNFGSDRINIFQRPREKSDPSGLI